MRDGTGHDTYTISEADGFGYRPCPTTRGLQVRLVVVHLLRLPRHRAERLDLDARFVLDRLPSARRRAVFACFALRRAAGFCGDGFVATTGRCGAGELRLGSSTDVIGDQVGDAAAAGAEPRRAA